MNDDMEKYLGQFTLPDAPAELRQRILTSAVAYRAARQQSQALPPSFIFGMKIFLTSAALIMATLISLNSLSLSRPGSDIKKYETTLEQMELLGISRENAIVLIAVQEASRSAQPPISM